MNKKKSLNGQTIVLIVLAAAIGIFGLVGTFALGWNLNEYEVSYPQWPFVAQLELQNDNSDSDSIVYAQQIIEGIDFAELAKNEKNKTYKELNEYFATVEPTRENLHTGIYKDKNLIVIYCESFSPYIINEKYTPYLYKITHQGYSFNFYNTVCTNTSLSEFTYHTGMMPDHYYWNQGWGNFYSNNPSSASSKKYLPFTLGNQFKSSGIRSMAFHYNYAYYFRRNLSHPNFGYDFYTLSNYLKGYSWPNSDLEMMKQSMPKLLEKDENGNISQFNAYFLTFAGHTPYNYENAIARKYRSFKNTIKGIYKNESVQNYVSAHQDLELAIEHLYKSLEEAGILEDTIICITADHFPYGLGLTALSELAGKNLTANAQETILNKHKGIFTIFDATMDGLVEVSDPMCSYDIVPTISNLWDFEYDSRLLMGRDIFADCEHVAVFYDFEFVTDDYYYIPKYKKAYSLNGGEIDQAKVNELIKKIEKQYDVSKKVISSDYYNYLLK